MNDVKFSLGLLEAIQQEARRDDMSFAEKSGLYAATKAVCAEFHTHIDEARDGDGYAHEKVTQFEWHIGAMLGFDISNGHHKSMHLGWAMGALQSLSNVLTAEGESE